MKTRDFLQSHGLDELCSRFAIAARRHRAHPDLVQLKYSQIESPMAEPIVQECRGLIVDEADGWRIVCRAYDKFFNHGEPNVAAIDWTTARVYEKLDGSLMTLYAYRGAWHVASSALPDAAGPAHAAGITFAELFRRTWADLGYAYPDVQQATADGPLCYMFELMTPANRIIVSHERPRIVLHGVRNLRTMRELEPEPIAQRHGWECTATFPLATIEQCLDAAKDLTPMRGEGYVVRDAAFARVKVKSPRYVALAHLKDAMTGRRLLEIIRANESDEFLTYFPEFVPAYQAVQREYAALCDGLEADYARLRTIADQKTFAAQACQTRCSSPLFSLRGGKCRSVREFFAGCTIQTLERAMRIDLASLIVAKENAEDPS
jgi:hypothetical protein